MGEVVGCLGVGECEGIPVGSEEVGVEGEVEGWYVVGGVGNAVVGAANAVGENGLLVMGSLVGRQVEGGVGPRVGIDGDNVISGLRVGDEDGIALGVDIGEVEGIKDGDVEIALVLVA